MLAGMRGHEITGAEALEDGAERLLSRLHRSQIVLWERLSLLYCFYLEGDDAACMTPFPTKGARHGESG